MREEATGRQGRRARTRRSRRSLGTKVLLSISLVTVAAALVGMGAFAVFTNSATVSQSDSTGTVTLAPINVNGTNNRLSVGASNLAAGDTIQRSVDVKNTGSLTLANVTLTTTATTSSLLDTDTTNGLQMVIDKCSVAWTETGGPPYTYTCGGTTTSVLASAPVIGTNLTLANITLTAGTDNFLPRHADAAERGAQHPAGPVFGDPVHVHRDPAGRSAAVRRQEGP